MISKHGHPFAFIFKDGRCVPREVDKNEHALKDGTPAQRTRGFLARQLSRQVPSHLLYLCLAIFSLLFFNGHKFVHPDWIPAHDTLNQLTEFLYALSSWKNAELPLWNSYLYGGQPFYLLLNHGLLLNPVMWIWFFFGGILRLSPIQIFVFSHLSEIVFFAFGGYFLAKEIFDETYIALSAFIILLFSGEANTWSHQIWGLAVIEYLPWILFFALRYAKTQRRLYFLATVAVFGISANTYQPVYTVTFLLSSVLLVFFLRFDFIRRLRLMKFAKDIIVSLPLALMLASPSALIYSELRRDHYQIGRFKNTEQRLRYEERMSGEGGVTSFGSWERIFPGMFVVWRRYLESVPFVGLFAFLYAFFAAGLLFSPNTPRRSRERVSSVRNILLCAGLLLAALFNYLAWPRIIHRFFYNALPFYHLLRSFGFFSGQIALMVVLLSCAGIRYFLSRRTTDGKATFSKRDALFLLFFFFLAPFLPKADRIFALLLVAAASLFLTKGFTETVFPLNRYRHLVVILLWALGSYNLFAFNALPYHNVRSPIFSYGKNFNFSAKRPDGYTRVLLPDSAVTECCITFFNIAEKFDGPWFFGGWGSLHTLFVDKRYYHFSKVPGFARLMKDKFHFFRYYVVEKNWQRVADLTPFLDCSLLILPEEEGVRFRSARKKTAGHVTMEEDQVVSFALLSKTANKVKMEVSAPQDGFLLYTDLYHGGFRATVDGKKAALLRGFGLFKAVELEKGFHEVAFVFDPFFGRVLLAYLVVAVGVFTALLVYIFRRLSFDFAEKTKYNKSLPVSQETRRA